MTHPETGNVSQSPSLAFRQLREAFDSGDLELAQQSYAIVKQYAPPVAGAPDAASAAFEELGRGLALGELGMAKVAFEIMQSMLKPSQDVHAQRREVSSASAPAPKKVDIVG